MALATENKVKDAAGKTAYDYGQEWAEAKKNGASQADLDAIHAKAEAVRAQEGYSGGADGSQRIDIAKASSDTTAELEKANADANNKGRTAPDASTLKPKVNVAEETTVKDAAGYTASDYGDMWAKAYLEGASQDVLDEYHQKAEAVRKLSNYSGGKDGSEYISLAVETPETQNNIMWRQEDLYNTLDDTNATMEEKYTKLGDLLTEKANNEVDEATRQAINTLNATLEEYTTLYNQERSKAAYSMAQANDNMVLRNTAAGDMGGIGNKLYSDQQANYDSQITSIDLEQANLMSDTARQIADLVAQGDYTKAQNVLEIGISNLENMINQENQLISWKMNLASNLDNLDYSKMQFDEDVREYNTSLALNKLQLGMFSSDDAKTLGISDSQAQAYADRVNALADYDLESARLSLEAATLSNQADKENAFLNKLKMGTFNEADAIALGIDTNWAKDYADYINTLMKVDLASAQAELAKLISSGTNNTPTSKTPNTTDSPTAEDLYKIAEENGAEENGIEMNYIPFEVADTKKYDNGTQYTLDSGNQVNYYDKTQSPADLLGTFSEYTFEIPGYGTMTGEGAANSLSSRGYRTFQSIANSKYNWDTTDEYKSHAAQTLNFAHANGAVTDEDYVKIATILQLGDYI